MEFVCAGLDELLTLTLLSQKVLIIRIRSTFWSNFVLCEDKRILYSGV